MSSSESNQAKSKHGKNRANIMRERLNELCHEGELRAVREKERKGYPGYNRQQFYAPFEIEFEDGARWEIFSTTCWKDRYKQSEWDAFNLKQIDPRIEQCVISLSNTDAVTLDDARRENSKRENEEVYSFIDSVFIDEELFAAIEDRAYEVGGYTPGQISNKKGKRFERHVVKVLKSAKNLAKYQSGDSTLVGHDFGLFETMMQAWGLDARTIRRIEATDNVPRLSTGGKPKTDVIATVHFLNGSTETFTISCKHSKKDWVSVMQFDAQDLVEAADIDDPELVDALYIQQECGSRKQIELKYGYGPIKTLCELLPKYYEKMAQWIVGGVSHPTCKEQVAGWVLTRKARSDGSSLVHFVSVKEYIDEIRDIDGQYGTPFRWTYHGSGGKKQIQVKMPVL